MTALATIEPAGQGLASVDTSLQLGESEPLPEGLKRVTMEQLEVAAEGFFEGEEYFPTAVHESRKAIKRIRALLRLVKGEIPDKIYGFEDRMLRDTARSLQEVRAAVALAEAARLIVALYGDLLAHGVFDELVARLERRRQVIELKTLEDPHLVARVVRNLEKAYHRYSSWPTDPEARRVYGMGIRDSYEAIKPGLSETYQRGRKGMVSAYGSRRPGHFHGWRKRVKDLRHQMEFLAPLWPEVVVGMAVTLHRLGELLGEDHDLAELAVLVATRTDLCPDPRERSLLIALVRQRRWELETAAEVLGRRIYAEKPAALTSRFAEYWDSRRLAIEATSVVVY